MLRMSKSLFNIPVMSLRVGTPIAIATEPVINPHNLKIIGWWCKQPGGGSLQVLLTEDVRDNTSRGLVVDNEDALSTPEDLVRHKETLSIHFQLIDKLVKTKRQKIG